MNDDFADYALILIDCQKGFDDPIWGKRNNPQFEVNAKLVLQVFRQFGAKIIHVRHSSTEKNSPLSSNASGFEFYDWALPENQEIEIIKNVNSCFIGTNLLDFLNEKHYKKLAILGLTTNHCVSTTVRMAGNYGFNVKLIGDACATFPRISQEGEFFDADLIHKTALLSLNGEFCEVIKTEQIV